MFEITLLATSTLLLTIWLFTLRQKTLSKSIPVIDDQGSLSRD